MSLPEQDIQFRLYEGDETALSELYQNYHAKLVQFAKTIVRNKEGAEEVVEDVFVKVWRHREKVKDIQNLRTYLYIAVKNTSLNMLSQKSAELVTASFDFLNIEIEDNSADLENILITEEMLGKMHKAIDNLPPRCKMIFKLVREDRLKYREIADILNISVNTIDAQMAIAVKRICTALSLKKSFVNAYKSRMFKKI